MKKISFVFCIAASLLFLVSCKKDLTEKSSSLKKTVLSVNSYLIGATSRIGTSQSNQTNEINIILPDTFPPQNKTLHVHSNVLLEYGDGYFTQDSSSLHTFLGNPNQMAALMTVTKHYDGGGPRRVIKENYSGTGYSFVNDIRQSNTKQNFIPPNRKVKIIPCVNSIVPADQMVFAITYNSNNISEPKLEFLYNKTNIHDFDIFDPVDGSGTVACSDGTNISAIRTYTNSSHVSTGIPDINTGFRQAISFDLIDTIHEDLERNLFVSLNPSNHLDPYWFPDTQILAILKDGNNIIDTSIINLKIPVKGSHDPNLLTIQDVSEKDPFYKTYKINLDFENDEEGLVFKVKAKIKLPLEIDKSLIRSSITSSFGGRNYDKVKLAFTRINDQLSLEIIAESFDPWYLLINGKSQRQHFGALTNKGSVSFLVKTHSFDTNLASQAEVIFNNEPPVLSNLAKSSDKFLPFWNCFLFNRK